MKFIDSTTHAPTSCLIEDYNSILEIISSIETHSCDTMDLIDRLNTVAECLSDTIKQYTDPLRQGKEVLFTPSPSSLIAMSIKSGIMVTDKGEDPKCTAGHPISSRCDGCWQCSQRCAEKHGCDPEHGLTVMAGGYGYLRGSSKRDEALLEAMERQEQATK